MKEFLRQLFSEKGDISAMRVMCMLSLITGCYIGIAGLYQNKALTDVSVLVGVFLSAAITGKAVQKRSENKENE